jgi:sRNA-binding protein
MATLTAPTAARAAAKERGLVPPPKPETLVPAETKGSEKQIRIAQCREQQRIARDHLWPLLSKVFPEVFSLPAVPLAIGIHKQILDIAGDSIDATELGAFMRYWVRRWSYLMAVWRGEPRRNLDGSVAGSPTIDQRNDAARKLWGDRARQITADKKDEIDAD